MTEARVRATAWVPKGAISGAKVCFVNSENSFLDRCVTADDTGRYTAILVPGRYSLTLASGGLVVAKYTVRLEARNYGDTDLLKLLQPCHEQLRDASDVSRFKLPLQ